MSKRRSFVLDFRTYLVATTFDYDQFKLLPPLFKVSFCLLWPFRSRDVICCYDKGTAFANFQCLPRPQASLPF